MRGRNRRPLIGAGIMLGLGLGGLLDGILFRQILQWHHLLSSAGYPDNTLTGLEINLLADGFFQMMMWIVVVTGVALLWRASRQPGAVWSPRLFGGATCLGIGLYNMLEGLLAHYALGIHHVKEGPAQAVWDLAFVAVGAVLIAIGAILAASGWRSRIQPMNTISGMGGKRPSPTDDPYGPEPGGMNRPPDTKTRKSRASSRLRPPF